ncbi:hypothetical protein CSPB12327_02965 [Campylobacter sp. RM12327]|uniref:hypothetical protein n=1 Tax=Campylobacter sputorum TaxID=206 RepID=UPI000B79720E|nr:MULTISPECIES: hypothetical protein [Campylobacter]ASM40504.1 hypothetical protein CSPB_1313 [Campylobacter sputorum]MBE7357831.1 hypothetical protein [Campylobacter sp. RM11302]MBF6669109.1 hypothetical protein [Campylobacter sp. RM12327]MBF6673882.1 hypothetical protein [Campylobacter sp. RM13538]MBF6675849.1 hypothetical protein [Campylobacter sp. RM12321]
MKIQNTHFYDNIFVNSDKIKQNSIKEGLKTEESVKPKDPIAEIWNKIEKLKKQLSNLQARIAKLSSNKDEASKELVAQLNVQCGQINAQILALFEQLLKGNVKA